MADFLLYVLKSFLLEIGRLQGRYVYGTQEDGLRCYSLSLSLSPPLYTAAAAAI